MTSHWWIAAWESPKYHDNLDSNFDPLNDNCVFNDVKDFYLTNKKQFKIGHIVTLAGLFTVPYFCRSFSINLSMGDNTCLRWYHCNTALF